MIPCCIDQGVGLIPWSPLARGFFNLDRRKEDWGDSVRAKTDEYSQQLYYREEDFLVAKRVQELAKARGASPAQIALAWMLNKPHITAPIIGASQLQHLEENVAALEIKLSDEEVKQLEELYEPHPILGHI
jgi:aryl-alcohol dehydrogenase-like predicted oxidoreductase